MTDDREAEDLLKAQQARERAERLAAEHAAEDEEALQHERRSDKARYLREKLQERVASEQPDPRTGPD